MIGKSIIYIRCIFLRLSSTNSVLVQWSLGVNRLFYGKRGTNKPWFCNDTNQAIKRKNAEVRECEHQQYCTTQIAPGLHNVSNITAYRNSRNQGFSACRFTESKLSKTMITKNECVSYITLTCNVRTEPQIRIFFTENHVRKLCPN